MSDIVVVGCGRWGKNHVRCWSELGVLRGVYDSNIQLAEEKAKEFSVNPYKDIDEVLQDGSVRAVVIAVPVEHHFSLSDRCLKAGKHVLVEKPMTSTSAEALSLVKSAEQRDLVLAVGHILEYHPAVIRLRQLVKTGSIGNIREIYSHRLNAGIVRQFENVWWSFAPHDILLMLNTIKLQMDCEASTADEIVDSISAFSSDYTNRGIYDSTLSFFRFRNGATGHIYVSWMHPYRVQSFVVVGTRGAIEFTDTNEGDKLRLYNQAILSRGSQVFLERGDYEAVEIECKEPLKEECIDFLNCINSQSNPKSSGRDGLAVIRLLEKAEASSSF